MLVPAAQAFAETATVTISGSGSGEVSSAEGFAAYEPGGEPLGVGTPAIECSYASPGPQTGVCENEMEELGFAAADALIAIPAPGSEFAGWTHSGGFQSGVFYEPAPCRTNQSEGSGTEAEKAAAFPKCFAYTEEGSGSNVTLTAKFVLEPPKFPLTIAKTGEGTITSSPAGILCTGAKTGAECVGKFETGSTVTLTASPAKGYAFSAWAGCTEHVGLTCKVTMSKALTVKVTFVATPSLTIEKPSGQTGKGKVSATGISCDENCTKAVSSIKTGTSVTIKTTPAKDSEAAVISGGTGSASACSGSTCTFTITEDSVVAVKFQAIPTHKLVVFLNGPAAYKGKVTGKGTVKGLTASAINCGSGCTNQTESFFSTDEVTLSAVAGTGYTFAGWGHSVETNPGTCTGKTMPCTIPMSADGTITAKFE
jgi:hypothetical protein